MGEFTSELLAALAVDQTRRAKDPSASEHPFIQQLSKQLGPFEDGVFDEAAQDTIQNFKDGLFLIVMMRARNYMLHNREDDKLAKDRYAPVDIQLQLTDGGVLHTKDRKKGVRPKTKDIIPRVMPSVWDKRDGLDIRDFIEDISNHMLLACK